MSEPAAYLPSTLPTGQTPVVAPMPPVDLSTVTIPVVELVETLPNQPAPPIASTRAADFPPPPLASSGSQVLHSAPPPQPYTAPAAEPERVVFPSSYYPTTDMISVVPDFHAPPPPGAHEHQPTPEVSPMESPTVLTPAHPEAVTPPAFASRRDPSLNVDPELDAALQTVLMTSGSDLHVTVDAPPMIRVDGALKPMVGASIWDQDKVTTALLSILTPEQKERFDGEMELDFAYTLSANARFRVNFYQQRNNIGAAFRLIPTEIKSLRDLGVPEVIGNFAKLARGLVLVTGPTGSGKSTTLAGVIDLVNRTRADHIMTVEDPIEFLHSNHKSLVNQREVGHDTHSFAAALKHVLRQDPDVILVGELRDLETISVALTAAETGHLVFATLHTQSAPQTIDRIIDVYPPHQQGQVRAQLAATLQGVVCQTLVKKASGTGRVVATEVLVGTHAVANLIREGKTYQVHSAMQAGRDLGMHTMDQHLADLVNTGQIAYEAAVEKAHDLEVLKRLVTRSEAPVAFGGGMHFGDGLSGGQH